MAGRCRRTPRRHRQVRLNVHPKGHVSAQQLPITPPLTVNKVSTVNPVTPMHLTELQLTTTLAALRLFQDVIREEGPEAITHMAHFADGTTPLTRLQIDELCEDLIFATQETPLAFFKVRPTNDNLSFVAWGALTPLTTEDPHSDPAEPLHYCFGATPEIATERLHSEMNSAHGMRQWHRQHSDTDSATKAMLRKVFNHFDQLSIQSDDLILDGMRRWRDDHDSLHRLAENSLA